MSEPDDYAILARLEAHTQWDIDDVVETYDETLLSLDSWCDDLVSCFEQQSRAIKLDTLEGQSFIDGLSRLAQFLNNKLDSADDKVLGKYLQTRGEGLCITFSPDAQPDDCVGVATDVQVRGTFEGLHIMPVPTDYTLVTGITDDADGYLPRVCVILSDTNLNEIDDSMNSFENTIAIPLQRDGMRLDLVALTRDE